MKKTGLSFLFLLVTLISIAQVQFGSGDGVITGQATQTASGNNIILATAGTGAFDAMGYRSIAVQIIPTGTVSSGVVTFEGSNDNTTFVAIPLYDEASLTANPVSTVSPATGVSRFFLGPLYWRYFRVRISTVIGGGGSLQARSVFTRQPYQPDVYTITQATAANLNTTVTGTVATTMAGSTTTTPSKLEDVASASGDNGVAIWAIRRDAPTASAANGDYNEIRVDQYGQIATIPGASGTPTIARVTSAATNTTILAANTARKGIILFNESTSIAYVKFGATASVTSYSFQMAPGAYWELPYGAIYTGIIDCIWASANGAMMITEEP